MVFNYISLGRGEKKGSASETLASVHRKGKGDGRAHPAGGRKRKGKDHKL